MNRGRGWIVAGATLVVLLAVWAASTSQVDILTFREPKPTTPTPPQQGESGRTVDDRQTEASEEVLEWAGTVFVVLLSLLALAALTILVGAVWLRRRRAERERRREGAGARVDHDDAFDQEVPDAIAQAAEDQLTALTAGTPRNAIVACWLGLEEAAATAGIARDPAETSAEFTARTLSTYAVNDTAITVLSALYREARFSEHTLTEAHRSAAVDALRQLRADFSRTVQDPSAHVGSP